MSKLNVPTDPDTIEVKIDAALLQKAEKCVAFMQENDISYMCCQWVFGYTLFELADHLDGEDKMGKKIVIRQDGQAYVEFEPEDRLDGCHVKFYKDGDIQAVLPFKDTSDELCCPVGNVIDLKLKIIATTPGVEAASDGETDELQRKPPGMSCGM